MNRRLITAALLGVLLSLAAIDFFQDTGLIDYSTREMDSTVEDVLDNYGEAIRSAETIVVGCFDLDPLGSGYSRLNAQEDPVYSHLAFILGRKRHLDFSQAAFDPLRYNQVFLV